MTGPSRAARLGATRVAGDAPDEGAFLDVLRDDQPRRSPTMTVHIAGHDGTERGDDAVTLAGRLAALYDAEVVAVAVISMPPTRDLYSGPVLERLESEAGVALARAAVLLGRERAGAARTVFASSPAAGLQQVCTAEGAGLVTVGSSHRGPLGRVLAGSTAERLLTGSPAPVALAPRGYAAMPDEVTTVIAGYDGSEESQTALDVAVDVARRARVHLRIISVAVSRTVREHAEHMAAEAAERVPHDVVRHAEVAEGEPGDVLAAAGQASDVLVVGSRRFGPRRSVLVGSVGHHLAHAASCPVLVVPRGVDLERPGELLRTRATVA
jgi:nucleotide-binding universal stress UspA family protein